MESYRAEKVQYILIDSEINILDDDLRNKIIGDFNVSCELALESTFDFADKIYSEAGKLEQYDNAAKFGDSLFILHKRYDLLRTLLWSESVELKKECGDDFHTVVYLYKYKLDDVDIDSRQLYYSRLLFDLKLAYPDQIILIPIAVNTDLGSVDLVVKNYGITKFPSIIIDEKEIVDEIITFEEMESIVFRNASDSEQQLI